MGRIILTGGIASGKSTVVEKIKEFGIEVIDADVISREVFNSNLTTIQKMFGTELEGLELRAFVGNTIFSDFDMKLKLEAFMHPLIREAISVKEQELKGQTHIIDMPLYFESNNILPDDFVILISVPFEVQLKRLMRRNNLSEEESFKRINSQLPTDVKREKADYIINNEGTLDELRNGINILMEEVFSECKID